MSDRTSLYRHFDADGILLYVGISNNHIRRTFEHDAASPWFWAVSRIDVTHFETRREALEAEARAIAAERPLNNIQVVARLRLSASLEDEELADLGRVWHSGAFLTRGIIAYCKNRFGLDVTRSLLVAEFGRSEGRNDLSIEDMDTIAESMT